jgi:predicted glutamine amidotransferase
MQENRKGGLTLLVATNSLAPEGSSFMCRMIAAAGNVEPELLRLAFTRMAANANPAHVHEKRSRGATYLHEDGWGAAWLEGGTLRTRRSPESCLADPAIAEVDAIRTELIFLHARRASPRGAPRLEDAHPFYLEVDGRPWAFCHNGVVYDKESLSPKPGLLPEGATDSEVLFHHVLNFLDPNDLEGSMLRSYEGITDYSALHSFLATTDRILAVARRHPEKGTAAYHALWEGRGPQIHVVSSEPVDGLGCEGWTRIPEPGVVTLRP